MCPLRGDGMKKKLLLLASALAVLAGCAPAAPAPMPEPAQTAAPQFSEPSGVYADWSKLHGYEPPAEIGTRLSPGPLTEIEPSDDYGLLIPYAGEAVYTSDGWASQYVAQYYKYGMVTSGGCVVLDPVLDSAWTIEGERGSVYVLEKRGDEGSVKAVCALDGSWCTGFDYESVSMTGDGYLCLLNLSWDDSGAPDPEGLAKGCIMDLEGNVVFRLSEMQPDGRLDGDANMLQSLAMNMSGGRSLAQLKDGNVAFMGLDGGILDAGYDNGEFLSAFQFDGGTAFVKDIATGLWGVIDTDGGWVCEPVYAEVYYQTGMYSALTTDGRGVLIDGSGQQLWPGVTAELTRSYIKLENGFMSADYNTYPPVYAGSDGAALPSGNYFWCPPGSGAALLCGDEGEYYSYDGASLTPLPSIPPGSVGSVWDDVIVASQDGKVYLFDFEGSELLSQEGNYATVSRDAVTGELYFLNYKANGSVAVTSMDGREIHGGTGMTIAGGYVNAVGAASSAVVDMDGTCVFRTALDMGD